MTESVVLLGCGDVGPIHEPIGAYSELVRDKLAAADVRFALDQLRPSLSLTWNVRF